MNPLKFSQLSTISLLNRLKSSKDDEVLVAIILELVIRHDERVIDALIDLLTSDSEVVRLTAVWALGEFADKQTIEPLIDILQSEQGDIVPAVMEALRRVGDASIKPLVAALDYAEESDFFIIGDAIAHIGTVKSYDAICLAVDSINPIARAGAAVALGGFRDPESIPILLTLAQDDYALVRANAADALQFVDDDPDVRAVLLDLLSDVDPDVIENAIIALGHAGDDSVVSKLYPFLEHYDPAIAVATVRALSELQAKSAVPYLTPLLEHEHDYLRLQAIIALQQLGNKQIVPDLMRCLQNETTTDGLREIGQALARFADAEQIRRIDPDLLNSPELQVVKLNIGDPDAFQFFIKCIRSHDINDRLDGIWAFAGYKNPDAIPPLVGALLDGEWDVRSEAAIALGQHGAVQAINPLIEMLSRDEIPVVREAVAYGLGDIMSQRSTNALIRALRFDDAEMVRAAAAEALGRINDLKALKPLIVACLDVSDVVRTSAARSLGYLQDQRAIPSLKTLLNDDYVAPRVAAKQAIHQILNH